ncbi:hypothetical protein L6452_09233 [Arctium lappa]|uniref:Uncharacterized protein n=1 Tax=Arctium lappa TaxID=4217 RepID=A0ACB9DKA6_ARCLA|nr:hypothetical protein L6452_09233 [Arctium lappa]
MSELRSIITGAPSKSLVLVDEICRGTETAKGTCIAGSIVETLDSIGCLGIVSTHLHEIFKLPLTAKTTVFKAMGSEYVDEDMNSEKSNIKVGQFSSDANGSHKAYNHPTQIQESADLLEKFLKDVETVVCIEPPPSAVGASSVYVILRPDNRLYVGQTLI